ncbi:glutamate receptor 1 isoform X2 [Vespula maculifrons]|uniref:Glutamate receptor 1 isoform X2 n=1 Tax=Vespula maculifrons TaxID=7453 RepID=A0ABD2CZZ8_VESMC
MLPVLRETDGPSSAPRSRRRRRVRATARSNPRRRGTASFSSSSSYASYASTSSSASSSSSSFDFRELLERKDAENPVEDEEIVRGWSERRASGIVRPVSTSTLMTTALTLLLILLPAAFPDKINIGECANDSRRTETLNVDVDGEGNIRSRIMEQYRFAIVFVALPMRICGPATRFIATHLVL